MLDALQVLRRSLHRKGDFDVLQQHKAYEENMILKLTVEGNQPGMDF